VILAAAWGFGLAAYGPLTATWTVQHLAYASCRLRAVGRGHPRTLCRRHRTAGRVAAHDARASRGNVNVHIEGEGAVSAGEGAHPHASIRDVARAADVSYQTVSRVLNGHPRFRPETKQRVLDAMAELRYRPEPGGARARDQRSRTLGVSSAPAASTARHRAWPPSRMPRARMATG
jgi:hypothetical protein